MAIEIGRPRQFRPVARRGWVTVPRWSIPPGMVMFGAAFGVYLTVAFLLAGLDIHIGDATSRTGQAFFTMFSRDPHLAAIGFVWNPLPSLLQIPIVLVLYLLRVDVLFAGPVLSSMCGAATVVVLHAMLRHTAVPSPMRRFLVLLYALNPLVIFYSANGMTEAPFILLLLLALHLFLRWYHLQDLRSFALLSVICALMLQVRYEAMAFVAVMTLAVAVTLVWHPSRAGTTLDRQRVEAYLIGFLFAPVYSFGMWVFFNWTIMGDPLHFLNNVYGNTSQTAGFRTDEQTPLGLAFGSLLRSTSYGLQLSTLIYPLFPVLMVIGLVVALRGRNLLLACVLFAVASVPAFEVLMIYRGQSFGWLRFFMYAIPFAMVLIGQLWPASLAERRPPVRAGIAVLVGLMVLGSTGATAVAMDAPGVGREERYITCQMLNPELESAVYAMRKWELLDAAVTQMAPEGLVLLDAFMGYPLPLVGDAQRYVITPDTDFDETVMSPLGRADYVLVPAPEGIARNDRLNREYPNLWRDGGDGFELVARIENTATSGETLWSWALYRVVEPGTTPAAVDAPTIGFVIAEDCAGGNGYGDDLTRWLGSLPIPANVFDPEVTQWG